MDNQKRYPAKMKIQQIKVITLEIKFKLKVYEVIEEIADHGNVDTVVILQSLDMHTEKLSLGNIIKINEKNDCDKKMKMFQKK